MGAGRKTETFYAPTPSAQTQNRTNEWYGAFSVSARNLREDELGGVIFGCKHNTMNECLSKQLFGLPSSHFSYVKNVKPGMPLFLFNYSDRKMHGIYEAACAGKLNIDQFAWSDGGRIKTQFPAQVLISMKTHCFPVPESQFQSVIRDNYYRPRHFFFELDHEQTRALISLFKPAPVHDVPNKLDPSRSLQSPTVEAYVNPGHAKPESYIKDLNPFDVSSESHCIDPYKLVDPDGEYASASRTSTSHLDDQSSNWDELDDVVTTKEGTESVNDEHPHINPKHDEQYGIVAVRRKLQEMSVLRQQEAQSSKDTVDSASNKPMPREPQFDATLPTDPSDSTSKGDVRIEDLKSLGQSRGNAELLHIVKELSKRNQAMEKKLFESDKEILFLRESMKDTGRRIQELEYQYEKLQSNYNSLVPLLGSPHDNMEGPSIFLIGGYSGSTCLSSLDFFCPTTDRVVPLCSMSSARAYAAVAALKDHLYIFGGGNGSSWYHKVECYSMGSNKWITCPRLKHAKGSLAGTTLNDKIFAIGGGDGSAVFSEVEMFDPALGRWIDNVSMRQKRFAPAAAVLSGTLYVTGGYDGNTYLQSAERYDPREGFWTLLPSMSARRGSHSVAVMRESLFAVGGYDGNNKISTVEIFDPRANSWRIGSSSSIARGYGCAVTVDDNLYLIGGVNDAGETIKTVEVYNERQGWSISGCRSIGRRAFACAITV